MHFRGPDGTKGRKKKKGKRGGGKRLRHWRATLAPSASPSPPSGSATPPGEGKGKEERKGKNDRQQNISTLVRYTYLSPYRFRDFF